MPAPNEHNRKFIKDNYQTMNNKQISAALNITIHNVQNYKRRMGLLTNEPKPPYTEAERKQARREALIKYRAKLKAEGKKNKQYYKPKTEQAKRKSPPKSHLVANNAPTEKVAKLSTSENPVRFKIRDPYDPNKEYRYVERIDPNNGRKMLVEVR